MMKTGLNFEDLFRCLDVKYNGEISITSLKQLFTNIIEG